MGREIQDFHLADRASAVRVAPNVWTVFLVWPKSFRRPRFFLVYQAEAGSLRGIALADSRSMAARLIAAGFFFLVHQAGVFLSREEVR